MKTATKDYIINTVFKTNILPLISECNTSCIFCSHKQNPEGIEVFRLPGMDLEDFEEITDYLSPERKIVIGESATRIIEGEPLLHRNFVDIISLVRKKYIKTPIQITTNGILLNEALIDKLVDLGGIELNISVNGVNPIKRRQILGLKKEDNIREKISMLKGRLKFSGSFVYVPEILGWDDVEEIMEVLNDSGADTVRMFLPGYTSRSQTDADFSALFKEALEFTEKLRDKYAVPVIVEPSLITGLECRLEGVIKGTPSYNAGLKAGDVIKEINGERVRTRVEGFNRSYRLADPVLTVHRGEYEILLKLVKERDSSPGFVVLYDVDPAVAEEIRTVVQRHRAQKVLLMTSELAFDILTKLFQSSNFTFEYSIVKVKNRFFGGTIKCAGLLTVQDVLDSAVEWLGSNNKPDLIMLPPVMFDYRKRDLTGRNIKEIEERLKIAVDTI